MCIKDKKNKVNGVIHRQKRRNSMGLGVVKKLMGLALAPLVTDSFLCILNDGFQGLLRSRNELEEIFAMVEEKRRRVVAFWVDVLGRFVNLEQLRLLANSDLLRDQLLVYFDMKTQRKVQLATKINNLTRQLLGSIDERRSFILELEQRLPTNVMGYKTREELKGL
ncbi:hypothetical protein Tco_1008965 [Tanacetum coccineum]